MTSEATDAPTRQFFNDNSYFGLDPSQILFVKQGNMPCVSLDTGNPILLETPWKVARSPDGNGGVFEALHASGGIKWLQERGVEYVQAYAVDNALVRVADPVFYGYSKARGADVGIKVVSKVSPEESVGVVCLKEEEKGADDSEQEGGGSPTGSEQREGASTNYSENKGQSKGADGGQTLGTFGGNAVTPEMKEEILGRIIKATGLSEQEARTEMERIEREIENGPFGHEDFDEEDYDYEEGYEEDFYGGGSKVCRSSSF
jgi:hypothetical protein